MSHFVYILECADSTLYCGYTVDLKKRLKKHNLGTASKYTRARLPVKLVYWEKCESRSVGLSREFQLKSLTRTEKLRMIDEFLKKV